MRLPRRAPAWKPCVARAPSTALWQLRTCARAIHAASRINTAPFFAQMTTRVDFPYVLTSQEPLAASAPLCASYLHAAHDADAHVPGLAVGDDEGRVHLLDTHIPPDALHASACRHTTQPLVHGSLFALAWRADDQVLAVGGSDYSVAAWDVQHEVRC